MKYTLYEDAVTHKFAFVALPNRFTDGDTLPIAIPDRWFDSHEEAIAALPDLLNRDEAEPEVRVPETAPLADIVAAVDPRRRH